MKTYFITGLAALLMVGTIAAAAPGQERNRERIRVFYLPLDMGMLKAVTQESIEAVGESCDIVEQATVARIRELLASTTEPKSKEDGFQNQAVRIKLWLEVQKRKRLLGAIEQDGRMLRDGHSFLLAKDSLQALEKIIVDTCFDGQPVIDQKRIDRTLELRRKHGDVKQWKGSSE
jgi:hypothetical protein